jgi:hypothetical protein
VEHLRKQPTYLVFFAAKALYVTPTNFIHSICEFVVSGLEHTVRHIWKMRTSIAQVCSSFVVLFQMISVQEFPRSNPSVTLRDLLPVWLLSYPLEPPIHDGSSSQVQIWREQVLLWPILPSSSPPATQVPQSMLRWTLPPIDT